MLVFCGDVKPVLVIVPRHVSSICDGSVIRAVVDHDTLYTLIHALILSRLDYCNSLLACSSQSALHHLQHLQDAVARFFCGAFAWTHGPPLLKQLHWLPLSSRIQFNCVLLCLRSTIVLLHDISQNLSIMTSGFGPACMATSSYTQLHVTDKAFSIARPHS